MIQKEQIAVFCRIVNGQTVCICKQGNKLCDSTDCERDMVARDQYYGLKDICEQDKYGKVKKKNRR